MSLLTVAFVVTVTATFVLRGVAVALVVMLGGERDVDRGQHAYIVSLDV